MTVTTLTIKSINEYRDIKAKFLDILEMSRFIAQQIPKKHIPPNNESSFIFGLRFYIRVYAMADSVSKLIPAYINYNTDAILDYNSIFSLSRNIIECSEPLFYVCYDIDDPKEQFLRLAYLKLFELRKWRQYCNRIEDLEGYKKFDCLLCKARQKISNDPTFNEKLNPDEKIEFKRAYERYFRYNEKENALAYKMNYIKKKTYIAAYEFSSYCIHSFPQTVFPMAYRVYDSKEGIKTEVESIINALYVCSRYLAFSTDYFIKKIIVRANYIYFQFNEEEKAFLRNILTRLSEYTIGFEEDIVNHN